MHGKPLLKCDKCEGDERIYDSRVIQSKYETWRTRKYKCLNCGYTFETLEKLKGVHRANAVLENTQD